MTDDLLPQGDVQVLREDDERVAPLLADGWAVESESWDARLHVGGGDDLARLAALSDGGWWAYGAYGPSGELDSVSVLYPAADRVDTEFTVTRRAVRGRGLATAVKAAAVVDLAAQGHRVFGTGGSAVSTASLRANVALGYVLEPRWLSLRRR